MLEYRNVLLDAVTTGQAVASLGMGASASHWAFHITGAADVTAGVVTLEHAPAADYAGTWGELAAVTVLDDETVSVHFEGAYRHIRARITTTISGGAAPSVTVLAEAMSGS